MQRGENFLNLIDIIMKRNSENFSIEILKIISLINKSTFEKTKSTIQISSRKLLKNKKTCKQIATSELAVYKNDKVKLLSKKAYIKLYNMDDELISIIENENEEFTTTKSYENDIKIIITNTDSIDVHLQPHVITLIIQLDKILYFTLDKAYVSLNRCDNLKILNIGDCIISKNFNISIIPSIEDLKIQFLKISNNDKIPPNISKIEVETLDIDNPFILQKFDKLSTLIIKKGIRFDAEIKKTKKNRVILSSKKHFISVEDTHRKEDKYTVMLPLSIKKLYMRSYYHDFFFHIPKNIQELDIHELQVSDILRLVSIVKLQINILTQHIHKNNSRKPTHLCIYMPESLRIFQLLHINIHSIGYPIFFDFTHNTLKYLKLENCIYSLPIQLDTISTYRNNDIKGIVNGWPSNLQQLHFKSLDMIKYNNLKAKNHHIGYMNFKHCSVIDDSIFSDFCFNTTKVSLKSYTVSHLSNLPKLPSSVEYICLDLPNLDLKCLDTSTYLNLRRLCLNIFNIDYISENYAPSMISIHLNMESKNIISFKNIPDSLSHVYISSPHISSSDLSHKIVVISPKKRIIDDFILNLLYY